MNFINKSIMSFVAVVMLGFLGVSEALAVHPLTQLMYPENGNQCVERLTEFEWNANVGAKNWDLEISTSQTFTNPDLVFKVQGLSAESRTYSYLMPNDNATYYWRVKTTFTDNSSNYSDVWSFKTQSPSPVVVNPTNNSGCHPLETTFEWGTVNNTVAYRFELYNSSTMTEENLIHSNYELTSSTYTLELPQYFHHYYWRVSSSFTGCSTAWTNLQQFSTAQTPPTPIAPADDALGMDLVTSMTWTQPEFQDSYDIQIALDANFMNIVDQAAGLTEEAYTFTAPSLNTRYYWRVFSNYVGCRSEAPEVYNFKTKYAAPSTISPISNRTCLGMSHEFKWYEVPTAMAYRVQIATDENFENIVINQDDIRELSELISLPQGLTDYWWRVRAEDNTNIGTWSDVKKFTTTVAPVTKLYPEDNEGGLPHDLVLEWNEVTPGATYHLQMSNNESFTDTIVNSPSLESTTYSVTVPENNREYFWRVSASFSDCKGEFGEPWSFKTKIAGPTLLSPANLATNQPTTIFFQWAEVENADNYEINLSYTEDFAGIIKGSEAIEANGFQIAGLEYATAYYWRVRAKNEVGYSDWSETFVCTTSVQGPEIPSPVSPTYGQESLPVTLTCVWTSAARANTYQLQVSEREDFNSKKVDKDDITTVSQEISGLDNDMKYYWRVRAVNDSGASKWSKFSYFYTVPIAPSDKPELTYPANNTPETEPKFTLRWLDVDRAATYDVQVSLDQYFSGNLHFDDDTYSIFQYVQGLAYDTQYWWRVRGKNDGGTGPWSDAFTFTVKHDVSVEEEMSRLYNIEIYPNPVKEKANISFNLPERDFVSVKIYNLLGQEIAVLSDATLESGLKSFYWTPMNIETGVYYIAIKIGDKQTIKEVSFVK